MRAVAYEQRGNLTSRFIKVSQNTAERSGRSPRGSPRAVIVIEESTETLVTTNPTHAARRRRPIDERIANALVIALLSSAIAGLVDQ
jgi:hypothetical protein